MSQLRTQQWAIAYDISEDRERNRIDKILQGWGHRVQKSVFLVTTTRRGIRTLQQELLGAQLQTGTLLLFRLQAHVTPLSIGASWTAPDGNAAYIV